MNTTDNSNQLQEVTPSELAQVEGGILAVIVDYLRIATASVTVSTPDHTHAA